MNIDPQFYYLRHSTVFAGERVRLQSEPKEITQLVEKMIGFIAFVESEAVGVSPRELRRRARAILDEIQRELPEDGDTPTNEIDR